MPAWVLFKLNKAGLLRFMYIAYILPCLHRECELLSGIPPSATTALPLTQT